jgi:hypothetical protein
MLSRLAKHTGLKPPDLEKRGAGTIAGATQKECYFTGAMRCWYGVPAHMT